MEISNTLIKLKIFLLFVVVLIASSCSDSTTDPVDSEFQRGSLVEVQSSVVLTKVIIQTFLASFSDNVNVDFVPDYDVEVISIVYKTIDPDGNLVDASGVVIHPRTDDALPLVSWHHGTQTKRSLVGSQSFFNAYDGIIAASIGYIVSEPDYLGLGVSEILHPYHHEATSATSSIDMLRAAKEYCIKNGIVINDQLFLAGYSQGGYVTLATQKAMEADYSDEFNITASSAMAGAHDLFGTALYLVQNPDYDRPSFLSYLALAYNDVYNWDKLDDIFISPYNETVPLLYDGSKTSSEIDDELPGAVNLLFKDTFLNGLINGDSDYFANALLDNSLLDWTPIAPITLIHGNTDTFVPYENATTARDALINNGASYVNLITIYSGNHSTSILPAIEYTVNWFNTFKSGTLKKVKLVN